MTDNEDQIFNIFRVDKSVSGDVGAVRYKGEYIFLSHNRYCSDCKYFAEMPTGARCQKCDNGSKYRGVKK